MAGRPLLYTYRRCPYAMRARMALLVANVPFDAHEIFLRDKPAALTAASPKATVPVLVLPSGQVIDQSWAIVQWALLHPNAQPEAKGWWLRAMSPENECLLLANDGAFKHHLDRFKYPERFPEEPPLPRSHHVEQARAVLLDRLESRLASSPYLGGSTPCATDIGIFPFVRQFAAVDANGFNALPLPKLQAWLEGWKASPLFSASMVKLEANDPQPFPMWMPN